MSTQLLYYKVQTTSISDLCLCFDQTDRHIEYMYIEISGSVVLFFPVCKFEPTHFCSLIGCDCMLPLRMLTVVVVEAVGAVAEERDVCKPQLWNISDVDFSQLCRILNWLILTSFIL